MLNYLFILESEWNLRCVMHGVIRWSLYSEAICVYAFIKLEVDLNYSDDSEMLFVPIFKKQTWTSFHMYSDALSYPYV